MKIKNIKFFAILLVLLCCFIGAVSAAEDVSTDFVSGSVDDAVSLDSVQEDVSDSVSTEAITTVSDDAAEEQINEESNAVEIDNNKENVNLTRGTPVNASNWDVLEGACESSGDKIITLTGTSYVPTNQINFTNSATIIGTDSSYITGTYTGVPFLNENSALTITFINVKFRNMNVSNLLQLAGTNVFENCSFYNISAGTGRNAVIYNTDGTMSLIACNITNSSAGYGVVSNYKAGTVTGVVMNVDECKFINNSASVEPGAINNCGILSVNNSEFINNSAAWWAGAIHTHSNAQTVINNSNFTANVAGWNGGALYTYSKLRVYNSIFKENKCHTSAGGGAIGCSNWGSAYNITISNCTFENNTNLCGNTNETPSTGTGGAISAMNSGLLKVFDSTFIHNVAKTGQAIAAYSQGYENITAGIPKVIICNNSFINHTLTSSDTVQLSGNYTFSFNNFTNCYQTNLGTNNTFNNPVTSNNVVVSEELFDSENNIKLSSKNILRDNLPHDVIYVNLSSTNSYEDVDGQSWEQAYGVPIGSFIDNEGLFMAYARINNNGIIYLADGDYKYIFSNRGKSVTFIAQSKDAIFTSLRTTVNSFGDPTPILTFINFTINVANVTMNSNFINCTFVNPSINIAKGIAEIENLEEKPYGVTYNMTFDNCEFKDVNSLNSLFTVYKYGRVFLNNCSFDNIVADSIVFRDGDFIDQDGIYFYDCNFSNCSINGVVDIPGDIEFTDYCAIEGCDYDFDANTSVNSVGDFAHNYLNATKLKVLAVDSVVDISSHDKGVVVVILTDNASAPIAGATVKYSVNGGDEQNAITDENGKVTIGGLSGELTIFVSYLGNESYNPVNGSKFFNFTDEVVNDTNSTNTTPLGPSKTASKLTSPKVSATYNVAKKLTITLKEAKGKVLVNKKLTVKVGSISRILTTNSKGQVSFNVATLVPGAYAVSVKFDGDGDYFASSVSSKVVVSKAKPKIMSKAKTFKVKAKVKKLTVTLKDNKGKVLKNTKLRLKLAKKTYTVKTNKKGVATFKVKLSKKGKYTGTIKFSGSKYFKALSKKVKITVKK